MDLDWSRLGILISAAPWTRPSDKRQQKAAGKKSVRNLLLWAAICNDLCFFMSGEPHGAGQAAGGTDCVVEIETGVSMHMFYLFCDFKLFKWSPQGFSHDSGILAIAWMTQFSDHRNQHGNLPAVLSEHCFIVSDCKGVKAIGTVEGRQMLHTCQTWTLFL